jgi:hypothetical protein
MIKFPERRRRESALGEFQSGITARRTDQNELPPASASHFGGRGHSLAAPPTATCDAIRFPFPDCGEL